MTISARAVSAYWAHVLAPLREAELAILSAAPWPDATDEQRLAYLANIENEIAGLQSTAQQATEQEIEAARQSSEGQRMAALNEWLRGIRTVVNGVPQVAPWVQPAGAHDAVRLGEYRAYNNKNWRSLVDYNVWPPAEGQLWTQEDPMLNGDTEPPVVYAPWAVGLNVKVSEQYTYNGRVYRVIQDHLTQAGWTPPAVPALFADEGPIPA